MSYRKFIVYNDDESYTVIADKFELNGSDIIVFFDRGNKSVASFRKWDRVMRVIEKPKGETE